MLDYIFFDHKNLGLFVHALKEQGVEYAIQNENMGQVVSLPDDLDSALNEQLDQLYEELLQAQAEEADDENGQLERDVAGLHLTLRDGSPCTVRIEPELIARLLTVISLQELKELGNTIAQAVEQPDDRPLCQD